MIVSNYDLLKEIWNNPQDSFSIKQWIKLIDDYESIQGACGNRLEKMLLDSQKGLKACMMKTDSSFYDLIYRIYGKWKYTDYRWFSPKREVAQTRSFEEKIHAVEKVRDYFEQISKSPFVAEKESKESYAEGMKLRDEFPGIGVAGMSGILALIDPLRFGVVDQFVAKALVSIDVLTVNNPLDLSISDYINIEWVLFQKSSELKSKDIGGIDWTPREVDKALWSYRVKDCDDCPIKCVSL